MARVEYLSVFKLALLLFSFGGNFLALASSFSSCRSRNSEISEHPRPVMKRMDPLTSKGWIPNPFSIENGELARKSHAPLIRRRALN